MEITIKGNAIEVAEFVAELQRRQIDMKAISDYTLDRLCEPFSIKPANDKRDSVEPSVAAYIKTAMEVFSSVLKPSCDIRTA